MAKDSDKTTGTLGAEAAGGKLSGLLADEKEFDRRTLWRIGGWGAAAVATLIVAVLANQGAQSWRRDRVSAADLARQAQLLQSLARDSQNESRQLAAAIETLSSDRDRLYARVTVLEQSLDSVTGALARPGSLQASAGAQAPGNRQPLTAAAPSPAAPPTQMATVDAQQPPATDAPSSAPSSQAFGPAAPDSSVVAPAVEPAASDKTRADATRPGAPIAASQPQPSSAAMSAMAAAPVAPNSPSGASAASRAAPKSIMASPDPAAAKPVEPGRTDLKTDSKQNASALTEASAKPANDTTDTVHKTEFALDLGGANSINGLRALWRGLVKSNSELATLRPIIMVKEGNTGLGMQLRLGAGPLSDAAAAAKICARLSESQRPCETTVYDGQRLATRDEDNEVGPDGVRQPGAFGLKIAPGAAGTPANYQRRRASQQRHGAAREPQAAQPAPAPPQQQPEPKPAEPATLSALFRRPQ